MAAEPYKATFINEKDQRVTKSFNSPIKYRNFINAAKRSKKIELTSYDTVPN